MPATLRRIGVLGASALLLAGCMDPGGTGADNRTRDGAIIGGLIGATVGAVSGGGDRVFPTVAGATAGAIIGGAIGQQLDRQARELRGSLGSEARVVNTGRELVVVMPQDILFATGSDNLRPDLVRDLQSVAASLQRYPDTTVDVVGHTDNVGSAGFNQQLSTRRAESVANVLLANGVSANRVRAYGRGLTQPVASNATPEGRSQNRRVEIIIRPRA